MTGRRPVALVRTAIIYELGMWRSLFLWVGRRRPATDAGAEPFGYTQVVTPVIWAFIGVSAIELPLVHLLVPWEGVRIALDAIGAYGLLWMIGLLASLKVHPHLVDEEGLRLRYSATVDLLLPWEEIEAVRTRRRSTEGIRSVQVLPAGAGRALSVAIGNQTTVDVVLRRPLPLSPGRREGEPVTEVWLHADDAAALVRRLRAGLADRRVAGGDASAR